MVCFGKTGKGFFYATLTVIKIASYGADADIASFLCDHLCFLHG